MPPTSPRRSPVADTPFSDVLDSLAWAAHVTEETSDA